MYANLTEYRFRYDQGERSEADIQGMLERTEREALPLADNLPGFQSYHFVRVAPGVVLSISMWDDQAACERGLGTMLAWARENTAPYLAAPPERRAGEVILAHQR